jgi:hypothetical protein
VRFPTAVRPLIATPARIDDAVRDLEILHRDLRRCASVGQKSLYAAAWMGGSGGQVWREKYGGRGGYGTGQATWYGRVKMKSHRPMTIVLDLSASALLLLAVLCRLFHLRWPDTLESSMARDEPII